MKRIIVLSDIQYPYVHKKAIASLLGFIKEYRPDELACVGDELDAPEPSRWNRAMAGEYAPTLQASINGCHDLMAQFRAVLGPDKPFHMMRSNHTERVETYVRRYAPALASLDGLKIEQLLRYDEIGVTYHRKMYEIAPNTLLAHGDESGLSSIGGRTGLTLAKKTGKNVVIGHCHRLGVLSESMGFNGKTTSVTAMECGHLMSMDKAHYLTTGAANWQLGFGAVYVDGKNVTLIPVPIANDGSFVFEGRKWTA